MHSRKMMWQKKFRKKWSQTLAKSKISEKARMFFMSYRKCVNVETLIPYKKFVKVENQIRNWQVDRKKIGFYDSERQNSNKMYLFVYLETLMPASFHPEGPKIN